VRAERRSYARPQANDAICCIVIFILGRANGSFFYFYSGGKRNVTSPKPKATLMTASDMQRALTRIAHEIIERNKGAENLALVGIHTRGVPIAERLAGLIGSFEKITPPVGKLDITLYRDDLTEIALQPIVKKTEVDFDIQGIRIVLVDDVLYTGRTARAALDALIDMGRPASIQYGVLIDRGHRELPIRADYVGKNVPTSKQEIVKVKLESTDGVDGVELMEINT
jgi:pyrimidine operon attenuation protein / uracil phosphoribosyltransferase